MTTVHTAAIADNVRAQIATLPDRYASSGIYTAHELNVICDMLAGATVSRTPDTVTIRFARGDATRADALATVLFDRACEHLPLESLGEIVRTFTLKL